MMTPGKADMAREKAELIRAHTLALVSAACEICKTVARLVEDSDFIDNVWENDGELIHIVSQLDAIKDRLEWGNTMKIFGLKIRRRRASRREQGNET